MSLQMYEIIFGYKRFDSVTEMLLDTARPKFDSLISNKNSKSKVKKVKKGIAVCRQACHHRYGNSHAIWDHTVLLLPATRQR